jgi:hypothetical protein
MVAIFWFLNPCEIDMIYYSSISGHLHDCIHANMKGYCKDANNKLNTLLLHLCRGVPYSLCRLTDKELSYGSADKRIGTRA